MAWFTSLSLHQRRRKEALREARSIAYQHNKTVNSEEVLQLAAFILGEPLILGSRKFDEAPKDFDG